MVKTMKDSGEEWIGAVPDSWDTNRIRYCLDEINVKNSPVKTEQILSLVKDKGVMLYEEKGDVGNKAKEDITGYKVAFPNTLIVNSMNILIGSVGISKYKGCVSPVYYVFREKDNSDLRFVNYIFNTREFQKELRKYANGILEIRLRVSATDIFNRKIPLPPKEEQIKIADFLDEKCTEIDKLSEDIQKQIDILNDYKKSVITRAVTKGLDPNAEMKDSGIDWLGLVNNDWKISKIKYVCTFGPNCKTRGIADDAEISYEPMEFIKNGYFQNNSAKYSEIPKSLTPFENGDIVIAKVTPCFENGNIAIASNLYSGIGFGSSELFVLRAKEVKTKFLFYWLQNNHFVGAGCSTMTGVGGLKRVSSTFVQNSGICLPPEDTQEKIIKFLDDKTYEIDNSIKIKNQQINNLLDYKKSIIYEYVTGKKRVKGAL